MITAMDKQKVKTIIEYAKKNGWKEPANTEYDDGNLTTVIFSNDFAKAFFGSSGECHCGRAGHPLNSINCPVNGWKTKLKEMSLAEDRLDYLANYLNTKGGDKNER